MCFAAWCPALQMVEHALRLVDDLPLLLANLEAEVHVFKPVSIPSSNPPTCSKTFRRTQHAGGGHTLQLSPPGDLPGVGLDATIQVIRHEPFAGECDAGVLNRAVLVEQFTSDHGHVGMCSDFFDQRSGRGTHRRIEEHGLHIWFGCYHNAFRMLGRCQDELNAAQDAGVPRWPLAFKTMYESFRPWRDLTATDHDGCCWKLWEADFFNADDRLPWDDAEGYADPTVLSYVVASLWLAADVAWSLLEPRSRARIAADDPFLEPPRVATAHRRRAGGSRGLAAAARRGRRARRASRGSPRRRRPRPPGAGRRRARARRRREGGQHADVRVPRPVERERCRAARLVCDRPAARHHARRDHGRSDPPRRSHAHRRPRLPRLARRAWSGARDGRLRPRASAAVRPAVRLRGRRRRAAGLRRRHGAAHAAAPLLRLHGRAHVEDERRDGRHRVRSALRGCSSRAASRSASFTASSG